MVAEPRRRSANEWRTGVVFEGDDPGCIGDRFGRGGTRVDPRDLRYGSDGVFSVVRLQGARQNGPILLEQHYQLTRGIIASVQSAYNCSTMNNAALADA